MLTHYGKNESDLTKEEKAERNRAFKRIEKAEEEQVRKRKRELQVAAAGKQARFRFAQTEFRQLQGNPRELLRTAKEVQMLIHWLKKKFKYDYAEAKKIFEEDGKKLLARFYETELAKVK